jgi:hypothetical protein
MNQGFDKPKVTVNSDELNKIIRKYKKVKKYMRSPIYNIKNMDGTESLVSDLIKEAEEDPVV